MIVRLALLIGLFATTECATNNACDSEQLKLDAKVFISMVCEKLTPEQQASIAQWAKSSYRLSLLECAMRTICNNVITSAMVIKNHKETDEQAVSQAVKKLSASLSLFAKCQPIYSHQLQTWQAHSQELEQNEEETLNTALLKIIEYIKQAVRSYAQANEQCITEHLKSLQTASHTTAASHHVVEKTLIALLDHTYTIQFPPEDYILGQIDMGLTLARTSASYCIQSIEEALAMEQLELQLITFTTLVFDGFCQAMSEGEATNEHVVHN